MFRLFQKQPEHLLAVMDGTVISLDDVADPIFSQRMMGDGIAIAATGDLVCAPADGVITVTIEARHAFGMCLDNGMELIVHVGINAAGNRAAAFTILKAENERVQAGTPIIRIDRRICDDDILITPLIITNPECFRIADRHIHETVHMGVSNVIDYFAH